MVYRAIGLMSGSSLDGLDIVYAELEESKGNWSYSIPASACVTYTDNWLQQLMTATQISTADFLILHNEYGSYLGEQVNEFVEANGLDHKIQLIASHGHTVFHAPHKRMTMQLGNGAAIAAVTGINTVSGLRAMDIALGGEGAPIVPMGEKLLWPETKYFLNLGGIANLSFHSGDKTLAFDVCAANRVLNMLAADSGKLYDDGGAIAEAGTVHAPLLAALNELDYYKQTFPKSLANEFGISGVYPLVRSYGLSVNDALCTYAEHIAIQICNAIMLLREKPISVTAGETMMVSGGGAFNNFLVSRIGVLAANVGVSLFLPGDEIIRYKEALIMALLGILRWREENTVLHSVTGASRSSIGGAVWIGQEA